MATTLKQQLEELTKTKHRLAVWEALAAHLDDNFLSKDGRAAAKALRVPDCLVELVPEAVIEEIMMELGSGPVATLQKEINRIESQEIIIPRGQADEPKPPA